MAKQLPTFAPGDRVAFTAAHCKNIRGQYSASRRGTYLGAWRSNSDYGLVRWDDEAQLIASQVHLYGDDWADDMRADGSPHPRAILCKIKSAAFADTFV